MDTKVCKGCSHELPLDNFYFIKADNRHRNFCKTCTLQRARKLDNTVDPNLKTKICACCKKRRSVSKFATRRRAKDGLQSWCVDCHKTSLVTRKGFVPLDKATKTCNACEQTKPITEFHKSKKIKDGWNNKCKTCISIYLMHNRFNVTEAQVLQMMKKQKNLCAICGKPETKKNKYGQIHRLSVDHCHTTGEVRGLLCHTCNVGIGHMQDDIDLLKRAITYLRKVG